MRILEPGAEAVPAAPFDDVFAEGEAGVLGLAKTDAKAEVTLSGPPPVRDYAQLEKQIKEALAHVTVADVLKRIFTRSN